MKISCVIVADSRKKSNYKMLEKFIGSIRQDYSDAEIIVCEKFEKRRCKYDYDIFIEQDKEFNYNNELTKGIKVASGDYIALLNNDIIIEQPNTFQRLIDALEEHKMDIVSPIGKDTQLIKDKLDWNVIRSYKVREGLFGWFIFGKKETFKKIGDLSTKHNFWYSDNDFLEQCLEKELLVGSLPQIYVNHLESVTLKTRDRATQIKYTRL